MIVERVQKTNITTSFSPQEVISAHCVWQTYFFNRFYVCLPLLRITYQHPQVPKSTQYPQVPPFTKKYSLCAGSRHILAGYLTDWVNIKFKTNKCQIAQQFIDIKKETPRLVHKPKKQLMLSQIFQCPILLTPLFSFCSLSKQNPGKCLFYRLENMPKSGVLRIHNLSLCQLRQELLQ